MKLRGELSPRVQALVRWHLDGVLRSYAGNLSAAIHVVEQDWLPEFDDPRLETLADHLAVAGHPEIDLFLLRFGLTVPGVLN